MDEFENYSDEFIQQQIDYFNSIGQGQYSYYYCNEKFRREKIAKEAREKLCLI